MKLKPMILFLSILLLSVLSAIPSQIQPVKAASELASSTFTTASVRDANRMWLGGELDHNWFGLNGVGSTFGADHTFGRTDTHSIYDLVPKTTVGADRRSECDFYLSDFVTTNEFYVSFYQYMPSDWNLDTHGDYGWAEQFNPIVLNDFTWNPRFSVQIHHYSGIWQWRALYQYQYPTVTYTWVLRDNWDIDEIRGKWTHYEWWFYRSLTSGEFKFWVNGDLELYADSATYPNMTTYTTNQWITVPNKSYLSSAIGHNDDVDHKLFLDDLEIWDGLPEEAEDTTPPTSSNVAHNTTIATMPCKFSAKWMDDNALSGYIFSKKEGLGSWTNETWTALTGSIAWANVTKTLPTAGTIVYYKWFCNDTSNNWGSSSTYSFTTTASGTNIVVLLNTPADNSTVHYNPIEFEYILIFYQTPQNASFWDNSTGTWAKRYTTTSVLNNTVKTIGKLFDVDADFTIIWNIAVCNTTHTIFGAANRTLTIQLKPYYSDQTYSTNVAMEVCYFSVIWYDGDGLSGYIFSNNVGGWHNTTWTAWDDAYNQAPLSFTETLPTVADTTVSFRFYVNDTDNNFIASTTTTFQTVTGREDFYEHIGIRTTSTFTYYMRNDIETVNNVTGYLLDTEQTDSQVEVYETTSGTVDSAVGFRVWHVNNMNETVELTDGFPVGVVERTSDGSGIQSETWTPYGAYLAVGWDSLKVNVYIKMGSENWVAKGTFTTNRLMQKDLILDDWTFYVYTELVQNGTSTCYVSWGSPTYNSRIAGVTFTDPFPTESMMVELGDGDFLGFLMFPMTSTLGNILPFGIILLMLCGTIYIRYHSFKPILVLFILFGGGSGIMTLMIPEIGMAVGWLFLVFGLAGLLWQLKR